MFAVPSPLPQFFDTDGTPLNGGYVYIGTANLNPETNPISVWWDAAGTQPVAQPIRTLNGYVSRNGNPATVYVASDFSLTVNDKRGQLVLYVPSQPFLAGISPYMLNTLFPAASAAAARTAMGVGALGDTLFTSATAAAARALLYPSASACMFRVKATGTDLVMTTGVQVVPFNSVLEQVGTGYDTTNKRFTAPVAGLYMFTYALEFATISFSSTATLYGRLRVNGTEMESGGVKVVVPSNANPNSVSNSVLITLAANDVVDVIAKAGSLGSGTYWVSGSGNQGPYDTHFSGVLLR